MLNHMVSEITDIYVVFYEKDLLARFEYLLCCYRYFNDIFFSFLTVRNNLRNSLGYGNEEFSCENKKFCSFFLCTCTQIRRGFPDFCVPRADFIGLYTRRDSFRPKRQNTHLIKILAHRVLSIDSKAKLNSKIEFITKILRENDCPAHLVKTRIHARIALFDTPKLYSPERCSVYLCLPSTSEVSTRFVMQIV